MRTLLVALALLLLSVPAVSAGTFAQGGFYSLNVPVDKDGDGEADFIRINRAYGTGTQSTADIQTAIDLLTDTGDKTIEITDGVWGCPDSGLVESVTAAKLNYDSCVTLSNNTEFRCATKDVEIHGVDALFGQDVQFHVIAGSDQDVGNENISVHGCTVAGGLPEIYDSSTNINVDTGLTIENLTETARWGIGFHNSENIQVYDNIVKDTFHSGIFFRNVESGEIRNNVLYRTSG